MAESRAGTPAAGTPDDRTGSSPPAPYQVIARRFRPKALAEVVGQEAIQATLKAELAGGRVPHAFLFAGSRGVGKTTTARILARCLNCERGPTPEPCGECALCRSILDGSNPDVLELDAASNNSVEDVRGLRDRTGFAPMMSRYRVWILDEAHMLSKSAWNALLKTLEEPPPGIVFVLATTELHRVPETIRSRCQLLQFRRIGDDDIRTRLRMIVDNEQAAIADEVLAEIAAGSRGGMRDAETALEQVLQLARDHAGTFDLAAWHQLTQRLGLDRAVEVITALLAGDAAAGLRFAGELQQAGGDERQALGDLVDVLRALLLLQVDGKDSGLVTHVGSPRERLVELAARASRTQVEAMIQAGLLGRERLRRLEDRGAVLELTIVRMAEAGTLPTLAELLSSVRDGAASSPPIARPGATPPGPGASAPSPVAAGDLRSRLLLALRDQPILVATIELCSISGPTGDDRVVLALDTDRRMHRDRLAAPALQQQLTGLVQGLVGRPVAVDFRVAAPSAPASAAPAPPPGPVTHRVLSRFGGRVVAVNPEDGRPTPSTDAGPRLPAGEPDGTA